jgi:hypothetical protein
MVPFTTDRFGGWPALPPISKTFRCSIADIEPDAKGVPVLLRHYLKAGGRLLGFNLDPAFSDVLDALVLADLRTAPAALLERCMGAAEARGFLEWHRRSKC